MNEKTIIPELLETNNACYALTREDTENYTLLTYEYCPPKEESFLVGVVGKNYCDARLKMLGLLIREELLQ